MGKIIQIEFYIESLDRNNIEYSETESQCKKAIVARFMLILGFNYISFDFGKNGSMENVNDVFWCMKRMLIKNDYNVYAQKGGSTTSSAANANDATPAAKPAAPAKKFAFSDRPRVALVAPRTAYVL